MQVGRAGAVDPDNEDRAGDFLPFDLRIPLPFAGKPSVDNQETAQVEDDINDLILQYFGIGRLKSLN